MKPKMPVIMYYKSQGVFVLMKTHFTLQELNVYVFSLEYAQIFIGKENQ